MTFTKTYSLALLKPTDWTLYKMKNLDDEVGTVILVAIVTIIVAIAALVFLA